MKKLKMAKKLSDIFSKPDYYYSEFDACDFALIEEEPIELKITTTDSEGDTHRILSAHVVDNGWDYVVCVEQKIQFISFSGKEDDT